VDTLPPPDLGESHPQLVVARHRELLLASKAALGRLNGGMADDPLQGAPERRQSLAQVRRRSWGESWRERRATYSATMPRTAGVPSFSSTTLPHRLTARKIAQGAIR
jgi:hypothetical protein